MAEKRPSKEKASTPVVSTSEVKRASNTLQHGAADTSPDLSVVLTLLAIFFALGGSYIYYRVDHAARGPFAEYVNTRFEGWPGVYGTGPDAYKKSSFFGVAAAETTSSGGNLHLTDSELAAYTGEDPDKPIYLAISGIIYDVSAAPSFYGPGGPYGHFAGRDASRAWVTECWDSEDQLTWDLTGVEAMFTPRWMDEDIANAASADFALPGLDKLPMDMKRALAEKVGPVSAKTRAKRREADAEEAREGLQAALGRWEQFFAGTEKYKAVGQVDTSERKAAGEVALPEICEAAMKKRPVKGGKLDAMLQAQQANKAKTEASQDGGDTAKRNAKKGDMPDFVKKMLEEKKKKQEEGIEAKDEL